MKSYCVTKIPENISFLHMNKASSRMVFCYKDDVLLYTRVFGSYDEADAFGLEYLDVDWDIYGFPGFNFQVSQKYLDYVRDLG